MPENFNFNTDSCSTEDLLGFDKYINTLSDMICSPDFKTPFCIGIYGKWGSGKTNFMRLLSDKLTAESEKPHIISVCFNPWRYARCAGRFGDSPGYRYNNIGFRCVRTL